MSLGELIAGVEAHEKTLTVYNAAPDAVAAVRDRFGDRNVAVAAAEAPGPARFAVLADDGEFVTAVGLDALLSPKTERGAGLHEAPYRAVLDQLDETMFTSYAPARMLAASREIEDRAWRVGRGEVHAGFQTLDVLGTQQTTYERLGEHDALDVHVYATSEGPLPKTDAFAVHVDDAAELRRSWFVAHDGGGVDRNKCALLAEERDPDEYYGFWTYDPGTVDYLISYLTRTYADGDGDGDSAGDGDAPG